MSQNVTWPPIGGTTYPVPDTSGEVNWASLTNYLVALAAAQGTTNQKVGTRVATTSPVTVASATDYMVVTNLGVAGPVTVNLPAAVVGQVFIVKDGKGDAATNNITINRNGSDTIDGATSVVINVNYGVLAFVCSATGVWSTYLAQAASATQAGIVTTGTQTFAGAKTFSNIVTFSANTTFASAIIMSSGAPSIIGTTSDGSDNRTLNITATSSAVSSRGAFISISGNETATVGGRLLMTSGDGANSSGSNNAFVWNASASTGAASSTIMSLTGAGGLAVTANDSTIRSANGANNAGSFIGHRQSDGAAIWGALGTSPVVFRVNSADQGGISTAGAFTMAADNGTLTHTANGTLFRVKSSTTASGSLSLLSAGGNSSVSFNDTANATQNRFNVNYIQSTDNLRIANANGSSDVVTIAQSGAVTVGPSSGAVQHTLQGASTQPVFIKNTAASSSYVTFSNSGGQLGAVGYTSGNNLSFLNDASAAMGFATSTAEWTFGASTSSFHTMQGAPTSAAVLRLLSYAATASTNARVLDLNYVTDTDCTGGYFLACVNQGGSIIGRIEAASNTTTSFTGSSDRRLKTNFQDFSGLDLVNQMTPKKYEWVSNPGKEAHGFVAQDLYEVYPEAVSVGNDDVTEDGCLRNPWGVDYSKLTPVLVKAIQEQQALIESLKDRIEVLEAV